MPGNPDATPTPSTRPSWLHLVAEDICSIMRSIPQLDQLSDTTVEAVAAQLAIDLYDASWLRAPEGYEEPSDEQLVAEGEQALREWAEGSASS